MNYDGGHTMNRFKCPACGRNQYTSKDEAEGCIYCVYKGPLENMGPAGVEKTGEEVDEQLIKLLQSDKEELKRWIRRMEYHCNKVNELQIKLNKYHEIEEAKRLEKQMLKDIEIEKAITYLEDAIRNNCKLIPERNKELRKGLCEQNWHFRTAIEALKKQVPRKRTGEKGYSECPLCDTCAIGDYCYKCGQRLNWGSEGLK